MKISLVIFTYDKNQSLLQKCLQSIARLKEDGEHELIVNVFEDSAHSLHIPLPEGVDSLESTDFPRGVSLNTYDSVLGQLECFRKVAVRDNPDWILKLDSDVMINHLAWVPLKRRVTMHGCTIFHGVNYVCGFAYLINPIDLDSLITVANRPGIRDRAEKGINQAEDRLISAFADSVNGAYVVHNLSNSLKNRESGSMWRKNDDILLDNYLESGFVTFKLGDNEPATIAEALQGMTNYWEVLKAVPVYRKVTCEKKEGI